MGHRLTNWGVDSKETFNPRHEEQKRKPMHLSEHGFYVWNERLFGKYTKIRDKRIHGKRLSTD